MDAAHVGEQLRSAKARLSDLRHALDRGVHRNELLVAAQETLDELSSLREKVSEFEVPISRLRDRYEKLVIELLP